MMRTGARGAAAQMNNHLQAFRRWGLLAALVLCGGLLHVGSASAACAWIDDTPSGGKKCASPTVTITTDAASYVPSSVVAITAVPKPGTGIVGAKVTKVEFYANAVLVGELSASPWVLNWTLPSDASGTYSLTAKVYDQNTLVNQPKDIGSATSAAVNIAVTPVPTVNAAYTPSSTGVGAAAQLVTSTTHATALTYSCSGAYSGSGSLNVGANQVTTATASTSVVGTTQCTFTATGPGGVATTTASLAIHPRPTVTAAYSPNPASVGQAAQLVTSTANATSLTYSCTGTNAGSGSLSTGSAVATSTTASTARNGVTTCSFTATGPGGSASATASFSVVVPGVNILPPNVNGGGAGRIEGSHAVSAAGAATFSIPIPVPPGTAGRVPSLSLGYSSHGGAGLAGVGWEVSGLSEIARCPGSIAVDQTRSGIALNAQDKFCLDGQRLIQVSGTHGANAEYRTEIDQLSRITSYGSDPQKGPDSWKVEFKSGLVMLYGVTADSYVEAQGRTVPLRWTLSRAEDRKGNYFSVQYHEDNATGEHYPLQIRYTGNAAAGLTPYNAVRFAYETRPDPVTHYAAGSRSSKLKRLTKISTWIDTATDGSGGTAVNELRLGYTAGTGNRSLLSTVSWCDGASVCLPQTRFDWTQHAAGDRHFNAPGSGVWSGPTFQTAPDAYTAPDYIDPLRPSITGTMKAVTVADLNGDGRSDLLAPSPGGNWRACLSTGTNFSCQVWPGPDKRLREVLTGDFDGDGRTDLMVPSANPMVCRSTGSSFDCQTWGPLLLPSMNGTPAIGISAYYVVSDANGDGRDDVLVRKSTTGDQATPCLSTGSGFQCGGTPLSQIFDSHLLDYLEPEFACNVNMARWRPFTGDFNGDGRPDVLAANYLDPNCAARSWAPQANNGFSMCIASDAGSSCQAVVSNLGRDLGFTWAPHGMMGDFNGDGLSDFALPNLTGGTSLKVCLSKGNGQADCTDYVHQTLFESYVNHVGDFDGDGLAEILQDGRICRPTATSLECAAWTTPDPDSASGPFYVDLNADGKIDLLHFYPSNQQWTARLAGGPAPNLLSTVTDGYGRVVRYEYASSGDATVHVTDSQTSAAASYPLRDLQSGQTVVKALREDNGLGGWLSTTYRYGGSKVNLQRHSGVGHRWMETYDAETTVTTRTEFGQAYPYVGMPLNELQTHANGTQLHKAQNTPAALTTATPTIAGQQIRHPYVAARSELSRELNTNADVLEKTNSVLGIDNYGNVTSSRATVVGKPAGDTWSTDVTTVFANNPANWLIGLPTSVTTAATTNVGGGTVTRKVTMEYDAIGLPKASTVEPDDPALSLKTSLSRDSFGNPTGKTLTWLDPVSGTTLVRTVEDNVMDARGRFATLSRNALGHGVTRQWDARNGQVLQNTDANGVATSWQYDGFGRKTKEARADGTFSTWDYRVCIDFCINAAKSVLVSRTYAGVEQIAVPAETFGDALGRTVATRTWDAQGQVVVTRRLYNSLGHLERTTRPALASATPQWAVVQRDTLGRATRVDSPSASGGTDVSTIAYAGLSTTTTNAKLQTRTVVLNGMGKLGTVIDANNKATRYEYDGAGNLTRTVDPKGNAIAVTYDRLGRKTRLTDPNLGVWQYRVDPLGQTWREENAKGQVTESTFDALGRVTRRLYADLDSRWVYDTAQYGVGKLAEAYTWAGGAKDYRRLHTYDSLGRNARVTQVLDWDYSTSYAYDAQGRLQSETHARDARGATGGPSVAFIHGYNAFGYLGQLQRRSNGVTNSLWQALKRDPLGRVAEEQLGNGLKTQRRFNTYTDRLEGILSGPVDAAGAPDGSVQNDSYLYDSLGNLTFRAHSVGAQGLLQENFEYDTLNRLTAAITQGTRRETRYDELGNITWRSEVGTYNYPVSGAASLRPHAVSSITGTVAGVSNPSFTYDANGNLESALGRSYRWSSFNHPASIDKLSAGVAVQRTSFVYGADKQRVRQEIAPISSGVPGAATSRLYYGGAIEKEVDAVAGTTVLRTYMPLGLGFVEERLAGSAVASSAQGTPEPRYFHKDHLGSPLAVSNAVGAVLQRMSYDAWGRRRNVDGSNDSTGGLGSLRNQQDHTGYTGQEHMDQLGLVHLNARLYDPIVGKMVSADPTVPDPSDQQAFNRYSYVQNNALAFVDPSGLEPAEPEMAVPLHDEDRRGAEREKDVDQKARSQAASKCTGSADAMCTARVTQQLTQATPRAEIPTGQGHSAPAPFAAVSSGNAVSDFFQWVSDVTTPLTGVPGGASVPVGSKGLAVLAAALIKIEHGTEAALDAAKGVGKYEVGAYDALKSRSVAGDGLDIHHAMQKNPAGQAVGGYNPANGPSIAVPRGEHSRIPTIKGEYTGSARDLLAKDIRDLRNYTNAPNSSLRELIDLNKQMYPGAFGR